LYGAVFALFPPIFALMQKRVEPKKIKAWAESPSVLSLMARLVLRRSPQATCGGRIVGPPFASVFGIIPIYVALAKAALAVF